MGTGVEDKEERGRGGGKRWKSRGVEGAKLSQEDNRLRGSGWGVKEEQWRSGGNVGRGLM